MSVVLTPDLVILAYKQGFFPMAESAEGEIYWHFPNRRAIFDIYNIEPPKTIRQLQKKGIYELRIDQDFESVIRHCSQRDTTWISEEIIDIYMELFRRGIAHSVETYRNNNLVGGLYGVSIGAAFFGESMFNLESNTAKLAFYKLIEILQKNRYILLDSQYINPFTYQLGAFEITKYDYIKILNLAIKEWRSFQE